MPPKQLKMQIKEPEIQILNDSDSMVNSPVRLAIFKDFSWEKKVYIKTRFGTKIKDASGSVFIPNRKIPGTFFVPTGVIPSIIKKLKEKGIEPIIKGDLRPAFKKSEIGMEEIPGVTLREAQFSILKQISTKTRGVIHAATGVGKSLIALGIYFLHKKRNKNVKCLFIAHTIDLVNQAAEQFKKAGVKTGIIQGNKREDGNIICATIQTLKKLDMDWVAKEFEVMIWDEAQHLCDIGKSYFAFVQDSFIPYRYGMTATLPVKKDGQLTLESAIGPVIAKYDMTDGIQGGFLSEPKVYLVPYKQTDLLKGMSYRYCYQSGIVENMDRNKKIVSIAKKMADKGESVLIFVKEISQGNNISKILKTNDVQHVWVHGAHSSDDRKAVKSVLENKECLIGICSTIWNEGVSINSLNNCIVAAGGKDAISIVQIVGRGTRVTEDKNTVKIWDFLDKQDHLCRHLMDRIDIYYNNGWSISVLKRKMR